MAHLSLHRRSILCAALSLLAGAPAMAQETLRLASGAAGGTFFEYGSGIARLVAAKTPLKVEALPSGGSIDNLRQIEAGTTDLGLVAMGPAFEAWIASAAPWTDKPPLRKGRALFPMYETPFQLATIAPSGARTARDLDGKKVGVGPKGGANEIIFARMAEEFGIRPELVFGDPGALADQVVKGEITATFFGAGAPIPAYKTIAENAPIRFIPLDGEAGAALRKAFPYLAPGTIPSRTYRGQDADVPTVALWNFVLAREGLPDEAAYAIVKAVMADPSAARTVHPAAVATRVGNGGANAFRTFHPGALRHYDEANVPVPQHLR